eukprot:30537_1
MQASIFISLAFIYTVALSQGQDRNNVAEHIEYLFGSHGIDTYDPVVEDLVHSIVDYVDPSRRRRPGYHHNYICDDSGCHPIDYNVDIPPPNYRHSRPYRYQQHTPYGPRYDDNYICDQNGCKPIDKHYSRPPIKPGYKKDYRCKNGDCHPVDDHEGRFPWDNDKVTVTTNTPQTTETTKPPSPTATTPYPTEFPTPDPTPKPTPDPTGEDELGPRA